MICNKVLTLVGNYASREAENSGSKILSFLSVHQEGEYGSMTARKPIKATIGENHACLCFASHRPSG